MENNKNAAIENNENATMEINENVTSDMEILSDENSEQVNGGVFKNVNGFCSQFVCKICNQSSSFQRHQCGHYDENVHDWVWTGWTQASCKNCKHNLGGIWCDYHGFAG